MPPPTSRSSRSEATKKNANPLADESLDAGKNPSCSTPTKQAAEKNTGGKKQTSLTPFMRKTSEASDDTLSLLCSTIDSFERVVIDLQTKVAQLATTEYIDAKFKNVVSKSALKEELLAQKQEIVTELARQFEVDLDEVKGDIHTMQVETDKLKTELVQVRDKLDKRDHLIAEIKSGNSVLKERAIEIEQYSRRNNVRIFGVDDRDAKEPPEETATKVMDILKTKLEMNIEKRDIDIAHRIGKFRTDGNRPIIVKFVSRMTKTSTIKNRRKLKGTSIVIREDLAKENQKLLEDVSEQDIVQSAWSTEGVIYALLNSQKIVKVKRYERFDNLQFLPAVNRKTPKQTPGVSNQTPQTEVQATQQE